MRILSAMFDPVKNKMQSPRLHVRWLLAAGLTLACFMISGCDRNGRFEALSMWNGSRFKPYQPDPFMPSGSSSQTPPAGTVWHGQTQQDRLYPPGTFAPIRDMYAAGIQPVYSEGVGNTGPTGDYRVRGAGAVMTKFPFPITNEVLLRGQERYDIYCVPCHGRTGYGDGMVVRRGFSAPPSYHQARLRNAPVGHFFDVITNGFGAMYPYGDRITPEDRWAITAYIRALQLSQDATMNEVPASERALLKNGPAAKLRKNPNTEVDILSTKKPEIHGQIMNR
ncbi:MAG: cytochrome c [Abditibacteriaceae bacterium]